MNLSRPCLLCIHNARVLSNSRLEKQMYRKRNYIVIGIVLNFLSTVDAQVTCAPDFSYRSAIGHLQGSASVALLQKGFKSSKMKDLDGFMSIAADPYVQHSPDLPDGWRPVWDLLQNRPKGFSSNQLSWIGPKGYFDNGEYLVMFREVTRSESEPRSKIFDLLRFNSDGLYAEHWDIRQTLSPTTSSGRSETGAAKEYLDNMVSYSVETEEANKRLVVSFLNTAFNYQKLGVALDMYVSDHYVQHSPKFSDGKQSILDAHNRGEMGALCYDIHYVLAQNDLVFVYSKVTSTEGVSAVVDLMRVRDHKLVEHWDVVQAVPANSDMPHGNGMF